MISIIVIVAASMILGGIIGLGLGWLSRTLDRRDDERSRAYLEQEHLSWEAHREGKHRECPDPECFDCHIAPYLMGVRWKAVD